jgi:long-subunit acyl-CoA synthetase (AMP-forming)
VPRLWLKFRDGVHKKMPEKKLRMFSKIPILGGIVKKKILTGLGLDQARFAVTGSAPIPADLLQWYRDLGLELLEGYAMTENFSLSHYTPPKKSRSGRVGLAAPDVEVRIADDGEIQVKSPATMKGYYKEPALTEEVFTPDGFLRTGDRGEVDKDGYLTITGRTKELFKTSKGKYVAPAPIENLLNTSGIVEQSCVMGTGEPQPYAVVMLSESMRARRAAGEGKAELGPQLEALLKKVNAALPEYERLSRLFVAKDEWTINNALLTPTMKIKRSAIEERYGVMSGEDTVGNGVVWED